jgi:ribosome maturation factor RimP
MGLKEKIETLIKPILERAGYQLVKIELRYQGRKLSLTITIDKVGGLSVEDCARASRLIGLVLDKADIIEGKYFLMVSSPGIE